MKMIHFKLKKKKKVNRPKCPSDPLFWSVHKDQVPVTLVPPCECSAKVAGYMKHHCVLSHSKDNYWPAGEISEL